MKKDEKRNAIVLYSGGLDSTYMVQYLIEQGYTSINLLFIELQNNSAQSKVAKIILNYNEKQYHELYPHINITSNQGSILISGFSKMKLPQPLIWLLNANMISNFNDDVFISYVMEDHAISYLDTLKNVWNACAPLHLDEKGGELKFPLIGELKTNIRCKVNNKLKYFSCENPKLVIENDVKYYFSCGHCHSCMVERNNKIYSPKVVYSTTTDRIDDEQIDKSTKMTEYHILSLRDIVRKYWTDTHSRFELSTETLEKLYSTIDSMSEIDSDILNTMLETLFESSDEIENLIVASDDYEIRYSILHKVFKRKLSGDISDFCGRFYSRRRIKNSISVDNISESDAKNSELNSNIILSNNIESRN